MYLKTITYGKLTTPGANKGLRLRSRPVRLAEGGGKGFGERLLADVGVGCGGLWFW